MYSTWSHVTTRHIFIVIPTSTAYASLVFLVLGQIQWRVHGESNKAKDISITVLVFTFSSPGPHNLKERARKGYLRLILLY